MAEIALGNGGLTLNPLVPYDIAVLSVVGEGRRVFRRSFAAGEPIAFVAVDPNGYPLQAGSYRWSLRLALEAYPALSRLQTGWFRVEGGVLRPTSPTPVAESSVADLTITDVSPSLIFDDTDPAADDDYSIDVDMDVMRVVREGGEEILTIQNGVVGLFQPTPDNDASLHISTGIAAPSIRFETVSGSWDFRVTTNDMQLVDTEELFPPIILEVEKMGSAYSLNFMGDGIFEGDFTAGSSRSLKRDLEPAASDELLTALSELPLYSWSYKKDAEGVRHLGPMAEDFHAAFGLGRDDKHISPSDTAGLALIAIQALTERLEQRDRELADLRTRLEMLESSR